jgi:hypothetical protein
MEKRTYTCEKLQKLHDQIMEDNKRSMERSRIKFEKMRKKFLKRQDRTIAKILKQRAKREAIAPERMPA